MSAVQFTAANLCVALNARSIIRDCSFSMRAGEFITIIGPNGAGKTTLLRALAGLIPYSGSLALDGVELSQITAASRAKQIGYLPQNGSVHWPMRVRDVVALGRLPFGAMLQRLSAGDEALVQKALRDCDVAHLEDTAATELSGGELSRILFARVLASDTPVILVDEPTASLDPAHQISIMQLMARAAKAGRMVVSVSHDISLAVQHATRMIALERGFIAGDGSPIDLLDSGVLQRIFGVRFLRAEIDGVSAITIARQAI